VRSSCGHLSRLGRQFLNQSNLTHVIAAHPPNLPFRTMFIASCLPSRYEGTPQRYPREVGGASTLLQCRSVDPDLGGLRAACPRSHIELVQVLREKPGPGAVDRLNSPKDVVMVCIALLKDRNGALPTCRIETMPMFIVKEVVAVSDRRQ
jgi:hypothetical protein